MPLPDGEVAGFVTRSRQAFVESRVAAGEDRSAVEAMADAAQAVFLVQGRLDPGQLVGSLINAGGVVGHLWLARNQPAHWYVTDLAIEPAYRGRGFGRAAMTLAEDMARADHAISMGLSVLGTNHTAGVSLSIARISGYGDPDGSTDPHEQTAQPGVTARQSRAALTRS